MMGRLELMKRKIQTGLVICLLVLTVITDGLPQILSDERKDFFLFESLTLLFGFLAFFILLKQEHCGLFKSPKNLLFLLPALIVAIDNFQFAAYFSGKMQPIQADFLDFVLFSIYCLLTGLFEEVIFRGVLFALIANRFEKSKSGLLKTIIVSSFVFGLAHLFNLFTGGGVGALLQVCYSTLTGLLFAFVLIKTKNLLCPALIHGVYNFCGLLFSAEQGLGSGAILDFNTGLTMFIVCTLVAIFAIISFIKYTETEREELYSRLGFGVNQPFSVK